ncbi:hypothetical protein SAMN05421505_107190 [Sinosporangium album]|uniref:4-amino-4-deoxy-L-arabinose transferase n=1 Tax=Sinosporangium album TaxID=504805 RepID=A0A1G7WVZ4_9ACTN|nr:hypothetical protein [Sinosporangium album]SDG75450.1 hypothetical protein SAMN05421505_107190 [Sinosporangium album]
MPLLSVRHHPSAPPAADARARPPAGRWIGWLLAGGWAAQFALRLWLYRYHSGPVANPDEVGYLLAARLLAGGPGGDYSGSTFYQGGYALLLVPAFWLTSDPETAYRLVAGTGAAVAAATFPLAYAALRRLGTAVRPALLLAFAAGASPSLLVFSGLALADAVLPTLLLGWLLAVHDTVSRGSARAAALGGVLAGFATSVHMRGYVIFGVWVVAVALLAFRRRIAPKAALAGAAAGGTTALAGAVLNAELAAALYPGGARDLSGLLVDRLTSLDGQAWALAGAAGQIWYLAVATWGLAGVGLIAAAATALRRSAPHAHRVAAAVLLATTLGIAYASSAALPDEHRVGNYAYGRYLACVALAWTIAGLAALLRTRRTAAPGPTGPLAAVPEEAAFPRVRRTALLGRPGWLAVIPGGRRRATVLGLALGAAATAAAAGGAAALYAGDRLRRYTFIAFDFPEVIFLSGVHDRLDMAAASWTAAALLACLAAAALTPRRTRWPLAAAVLVAANAAFAVHIAPKPPPPADPAWWPQPPPGRVAVDNRVDWRIWVQLTHRVWWTELELFNGDKQAVPNGVCSVLLPPSAPPPPTWRPAGSRPDWALWTSPHCTPGP